MFDQYRAQTLEYLTSDACANFEATRYTVQGAFYTVFSRLRVEGLLGGQALAVLTEVDDYLHCVQIAVAIEAVAAMPELEKALRRYGSLQDFSQPQERFSDIAKDTGLKLTTVYMAIRRFHRYGNRYANNLNSG